MCCSKADSAAFDAKGIYHQVRSSDELAVHSTARSVVGGIAVERHKREQAGIYLERVELCRCRRQWDVFVEYKDVVSPSGAQTETWAPRRHYL